MQYRMTFKADDLPMTFCWTRFGPHAGESIEGILGRKDAERRDNGGVFLWGVGNSLAGAMGELIAQTDHPQVLFSPIRGRPRAVDLSPSLVVTWTAYETMDGRWFPLPPGLRVRSHKRDHAAETAHYALVCSSESALAIGDYGRIDPRFLRNLVSGHPLGASQVTAVVERLDAPTDEASYVVAMKARLVDPYFVRLREPVVSATVPRFPSVWTKQLNGLLRAGGSSLSGHAVSKSPLGRSTP